jgi:CHASE2 domain
MNRPPKKTRPHQRWWSRTLIFRVNVRDLLVVIGLAITMQYLDYRGALSQWEGWFLDLALLWGPRSADQRQVITVEIDSDAYKSFFGSTSPLDPKILLKMVEKIARIEPKPAVIGVDILTEQPEYADLTKVDQFNGVRTVWAAAAQTSTPTKSPLFLGWFFGKRDEMSFRLPMVLGTTTLNSDQWGASIYFPDRDLGMRKLTRRLDLSNDSADLNIWARQVANAAGPNKDEADEVLISYNALAPREYKVEDIFACQPVQNKCCPDNLSGAGLWKEFEKEFQSRPIVLIGGTYGSKDLPTPIGGQPPLIVDAYAVEAELTRSYVRDFPALLKFAFDIPLGLVTVWLVQRFARDSVRRGMQISFLIAVTIIVANICLVHAGILWFSFAGVAFGTMLERLVELYIANPKTAD